MTNYAHDQHKPADQSSTCRTLPPTKPQLRGTVRHCDKFDTSPRPASSIGREARGSEGVLPARLPHLPPSADQHQHPGGRQTGPGRTTPATGRILGYRALAGASLPLPAVASSSTRRVAAGPSRRVGPAGEHDGSHRDGRHLVGSVTPTGQAAGPVGSGAAPVGCTRQAPSTRRPLDLALALAPCAARDQRTSA